MRAALVLIALALAGLPTLAGAATRPAHAAMFGGVSKAALIAAAKSAPLKLVDSLEVYCDTDMPLEDWLKYLTGPEMRRVAWTAGRCDLVNNINPLDGGGDYCVQATLTMKRPKNRRDSPELEIYLEAPKRGTPGEVYAFRAMFDGADGPDYIRERRGFEIEWRDRFKNAPPRPGSDDKWGG